MAIVRHEPWGQFDRFQDELKQVFGHFLGESGDHSNVVTSEWTPRVDIREEEKRFVILADIPGVDPKDIEVSMDKGILSIKGQRSAENRENGGKFTRVERSWGSFYRRFALPDSADADGVSASGKHGVLEISIPKKAETTPRKIEIKH
jgi:HSP20 family protein